MGHIHIRIVGCALKAIRANKWCIELLGGCDEHEGGMIATISRCGDIGVEVGWRAEPLKRPKGFGGLWVF